MRASLAARMAYGAGAAALATAVNLGVLSATGSAIPSARAAIGLLSVCAIAGAAAGVVYHLTERPRARGGWRKTAANAATLLAFAVAAAALLSLAVLAGVVRD